MQRDAAGEVEPVDRQRSEIEAAVRGRPVDPALPVEAEIERHAVDGEFVGAPFAAHQVAERELDIELVGADLAEIVGAADHDRAQPQRRRRQQPRVERAATRTGAPMTCVASASNCGRNWFQSMKYGPISAAISASDEGNRQSEQRRLHGVSLGHAPARERPTPPPQPPEQHHYIETTMAKSQQGAVTAWRSTSA